MLLRFFVLEKTNRIYISKFYFFRSFAMWFSRWSLYRLAKKYFYLHFRFFSFSPIDHTVLYCTILYCKILALQWIFLVTIFNFLSGVIKRTESRDFVPLFSKKKNSWTHSVQARTFFVFFRFRGVNSTQFAESDSLVSCNTVQHIVRLLVFDEYRPRIVKKTEHWIL